MMDKLLKERMKQMERAKKHPIILVSGPPAAGKTTYVKQHIKPGEIVFDFDAIYSAITFQDSYVRPKEVENYVFRIRDLFFNLVFEDYGITKAYIITSYADKGRRKELIDQLNAKSLVIVPDKQTCKERIKDRPDTIDWNPIIDKWYDEYSILPEEEVV